MKENIKGDSDLSHILESFLTVYQRERGSWIHSTADEFWVSFSFIV
jgi:hypothetical protein